MSYKKPTAPKTKQEQPLKFLQLIVRTVIFFIIFIAFWAVIMFFGVKKDRIFISELEIAITWDISLALIIFIWFVYLIFVVLDNTSKKLWETIRPQTSHSNEKFTKWLTFIIMAIITIYFSQPSLYSNANALKHQVVFNGKTILKENQKNSDNRFINVFVENGNKKYQFQGKSKEIKPLINNEIDVTVYQGLFTKYALIDE